MADSQDRASDLGVAVGAALVEIVRRRVPDMEGIYLFGSIARGRGRLGSDVDMALLLPPGRTLSLDDLLVATAALEALTRRTVDLSVLQPETQLVHAKEVVTTGTVLFARRPERIREFEMRVLSQYAWFLEDRAPAEAAYRLDADG